MRYNLKVLFVILGVMSVILGVTSLIIALNKILLPVHPEDQEGWNEARAIQSQQALDIIASANRITAFELEGSEGEGGNVTCRILNGPCILDPAITKELADSLVDVGKQRKNMAISLEPCHTLQLNFEKGSSSVIVLVDPEAPMFEVYERGYYVGRHFEGKVFFQLAEKVLSILRSEKNGSDIPAEH